MRSVLSGALYFVVMQALLHKVLCHIGVIAR